MTLPIKSKSADMKWPPMGEIAQMQANHSAWYSGDPDLLASTYVHKPSYFWGKPNKDNLARIHIPIAADMAATSADLLFGDFPDISISGSDEEKSEEAKSQLRLLEIIKQGGVKARLLESAETCSPMGGVFLKPTWDLGFADFPILTIAQADAVVPEFKFGMLYSATFWIEIATGGQEDNQAVYRFLEKHDYDGKIYSGVYVGTSTILGEPVGMSTIGGYEDVDPEMDNGYEGLIVRYVPNTRPNRRFRGLAIGQSDVSGLEPLMDALDETYSSWMRDIRLSKSRLIVPDSFLEMDDTGGTSFDGESAVYETVNADPLSAKEIGVKAVQFEIRSKEHLETCIELLERIITHAGYSPQTFGLHTEGRAESGVALTTRERRTVMTRQKKFNYWQSALEDILEIMLFIDKEHLGNSEVEVYRPIVKMSDDFFRDPSAVANTIKLLSDAQALSFDTKVKMAHFDWSEEQIVAEVERLKEEQGLLPMVEVEDLENGE